MQSDSAFLLLMKQTQLVDLSLNPSDKTSGFITPIIGIENGYDFDYDKQENMIYWIQLTEQDKENVRQF